MDTRQSAGTNSLMSTALIVVDHGSRKATSNQQLEHIAASLTTLAPNCLVAFAHMEIAEPSIREAMSQLVAGGATHIHVLPYFLGSGRHITQDIPQLVAEAAAALENVAYDIGDALGPEFSLAELLLRRSPFSQNK